MIEIKKKKKKNRNEQGLRNTNEAKFSGANKKSKSQELSAFKNRILGNMYAKHIY